MRFHSAFLLLLCVLFPAVGSAVDGVIEINQAAALVGGITGTDTAGFPVTIDASGSYRLTSNLVLGDVNTSGIFIEETAGSVDLDLNGFTILGPVTCFPTGGNCSSGSGSGLGILIRQETTVRIHDGAVRGVGSRAISLVGNDISLSVDRVAIVENRAGGIQNNVGNDRLTLVVSDSLIARNGSTAILARGADGSISVDSSQIRKNSGNGFFFEGDALVRDTVVEANTSFGISLTSNAQLGYAGNLIDGNSLGTIAVGLATAEELGTNLCNGNTTCP